MLLDAVIILSLALLPGPAHYYMFFPQVLLAAALSLCFFLSLPQPPHRLRVPPRLCSQGTSSQALRRAGHGGWPVKAAWISPFGVFESLHGTGTTYGVDSLRPGWGAGDKRNALPSVSSYLPLISFFPCPCYLFCPKISLKFAFCFMALQP